MLQNFAGAQAPDDATVVVSLVPGYARDLPLFIAWLPIFSRAYYAHRPFDETTLDIPLGCGPYKVGRFEPGRYIEYERVKEWWGADLPVRRGQNNFDIVRYQYYRDRDVAFEGLTSKGYLFREELVSRVWATRYDFPATRDGQVKRDTIPDRNTDAAQGWYFNTRREKFKDKLVREALSMHSTSNGLTPRSCTEPIRVSRSATGSLPRCSESHMCRRYQTGRVRTAPCCAKRVRYCGRLDTSSGIVSA